MPVYEYECREHGVFEALRPLAESRVAQRCPECGGVAPRVIFTAVALPAMSAAMRLAHRINENSRHAPKRSHVHGAGCGCAASTPKSNAARDQPAPRTFLRKRPWMISH